MEIHNQQNQSLKYNLASDLMWQSPVPSPNMYSRFKICVAWSNLLSSKYVFIDKILCLFKY